MKRFFTVYSKTDCSYCKKAINLLDQKDLLFVVVVMDKNPEFIQKIKEDTNKTTVPIILEHLPIGQTRLIGGSDDLENYLNSPEFSNG
jgi:glutaredoxin